MAENRSCKEHKSRYDGALINCATCIRWDPNRKKCREEIWVPLWISSQSNEYEESESFRAFNFMMRGNRGVRL